MLITFDGNNYVLFLASVAALLHACLQLPLGVLLHAATHSLGEKRRRPLLLGASAAAGAFLAGAALLVAAALLMRLLPGTETRLLVGGMGAAVSGLAVMLAYFRDSTGARLWVPRSVVRRLHVRIEHNTTVFGVFVAGMLAVLVEALTALPLLAIAASLLIGSQAAVYTAGLLGYAGLLALPLLLTGALLAAGLPPVRLQRWRAEGKRFWQFFLGLALILFGLYAASQPVALSGAGA